MKLPAYPRTKPSGVEWLGDVPEHWEVKRLDFLATVKARLGWKGLTASEYVPEGFIFLATPNIKGEGEIDFTNVNYITAERYYESPEIMVQIGDVLMAKDGSTLGTTNVVHRLPAPTTVNSSVAVLRPKPALDSSYFFRWLTSAYLQSLIESMKDGQGVPHLFQADIRKFPVLLPPRTEQQSIAAFLHRETGRVDRLVAKKRELIERLKEKRTALIFHTVTRGLPPAVARAAGLPENPPFKASGTEWLGDIPQHWEVAQLRRKAHILDCKHRTVPFIDDGIPLASIREVHGFEVDLTNAKQTSEEEYLTLIEGDRRPRVGDIIYSRNATVGDAALVTIKERFCMGQDVCLIRAPKHHPKFLLYLFRSPPLMEQVESLMIGSTFRRINVGQIHAFWICVPPLPEQAAIAAYLDEEAAKLDALVGKVEEAVERLQEYRTALVTAAVTGKIDVRKELHGKSV